MAEARPRPTLEQVAARAGVSRATVSRVVNGSNSVNATLAARVREVIDELNYVPNQAARALMTGQTNVVALVAAETDDRVFGDPFFSAITRGVSKVVSGAGRQLMLFMSDGDNHLGDIAGFALGGHCDGVLLISEHGRHRLAAELSQAGVPVVIGGRPLDPTIRVAYVDNDNIAGGYLAAHHLTHTCGRDRVATIAGPQDMSAGVDRLLGFSRGIGGPLDDRQVSYGDFTSASGVAAMSRLLEEVPLLNGVFAASDLMALGALSVLKRHGRRVPDDVALIGFDDIALAAESSPALTTIRQDTVQQGRRMAEVLLAEIDGRSAPGVGAVLPVELIIRESA
jgi:DNA-binding LacI/PurR family transcriptional regulator